MGETTLKQRDFMQQFNLKQHVVKLKQKQATLLICL
jgi:hypothetical protein